MGQCRVESSRVAPPRQILQLENTGAGTDGDQGGESDLLEDSFGQNPVTSSSIDGMNHAVPLPIFQVEPLDTFVIKNKRPLCNVKLCTRCRLISNVTASRIPPVTFNRRYSSIRRPVLGISKLA
ncbi:hypothetical protein U1Q18_049579 [Sarracenia purpurea var. burkii]